MANRETNWTNSDGLVVGFGTRDVETTGSAKVSLGGQRQQVVMDIYGPDLPDTDVAAQEVHGVILPAGALLESAKLIVKTAFAGATATMDIGIYAVDGNGTDDPDGIDVDIAVTAIDAAGDVVACDGAKIGTVLDAGYKVGVSYETAAFTAGVAELVVEYVVPVT